MMYKALILMMRRKDDKHLSVTPEKKKEILDRNVFF